MIENDIDTSECIDLTNPSNWSVDEQHNLLEVFKVLIEVDSQINPQDYKSK